MNNFLELIEDKIKKNIKEKLKQEVNEAEQKAKVEK